MDVARAARSVDAALPIAHLQGTSCDKKYPYEVDEKLGWKKITKFLLDDEDAKAEGPKNQDPVIRIIGEETVGKYKGLSKGRKTTPVEEPKTCKHPVSCMRRGGNNNRKYWTCTRCNSMWERQPIPDRRQIPLDHSDLMLFGRFSQCTYSEVYNLHADYVEWALREFELNEEGSGTQLLRFVAYCMKQREQELFEERQDSRQTRSPSRRKQRRSAPTIEDVAMDVNSAEEAESRAHREFPEEWNLTPPKGLDLTDTDL